MQGLASSSHNCYWSVRQALFLHALLSSRVTIPFGWSDHDQSRPQVSLATCTQRVDLGMPPHAPITLRYSFTPIKALYSFAAEVKDAHASSASPHDRLALHNAHSMNSI